jgi:tetratricopeptide (TPR) repeat protein
LSKELREQLRQFNARAPEAVARHDKRIKDPGERDALSKVLEQISQNHLSIDKRLDQLIGFFNRGIWRVIIVLFVGLIIVLYVSWSRDKRHEARDEARHEEVISYWAQAIDTQLKTNLANRLHNEGHGWLAWQLEDAKNRFCKGGDKGALGKKKPERSRVVGDFRLLTTLLRLQSNLLEEHSIKPIPGQDADLNKLRLELAAVAYVTGKYEIAEKSLIFALKSTPPDPDAIDLLGHIYMAQENLAAAKTQYENLLRIKPQGVWHAVALGNLGLIAEADGSMDAARNYHEESLILHRKLGNLEGQASNLNNLGELAKQRGDLCAAEKYIYEAMTIDFRLENQEGIANSLNGLGDIARIRGDTEQSKELFNDSMEIYRSLNDPLGQAVVYSNLGVLAKTEKNFEDAKDNHIKSLHMYTMLGNQKGQAMTHSSLGMLALERDNYNDAAKHFEQSLEIHVKLKSELPQAEILAYLGKTESKRGNYKAARQRLTTSYEMLKKLRLHDYANEVLGALNQLPPE